MAESETTKTPARLNLDPGTRRKARSGTRCLVLLALLIAVAVVGWVCFYVGVLISTIVSFARFPHKFHYEAGNTTLPSHFVVRPLIDANQTFDIAVTVWLRAIAEDEERDRLSTISEPANQSTGSSSSNKDFNALEDEDEDRLQFFTFELFKDSHILETPLYSDIVFRGLRLSNRDVSTSVNFRLPTAKFRDVNLTHHDLRASFVLIPSSPSLIDHITSYSSWFPSFIKLRPRRAWPFPLGSPDLGNPTLADQALDSFGISIHLIDFQTLPSRCPKSKETEVNNGDKMNYGGDDEGATKKDVKFGIKHPYVITRTQLRAIDETHLFKRKAYDEAHEGLRMTACQDHRLGLSQANYCQRHYNHNGHWETRLDLRVPVSGKDNETEIQVAYSPYLDVLSHGAGPLDLIAIPVDRENCSDLDSIESSSISPVLLPNSTDTEFLDINWRISYSGRSPGKMFFADLIRFYPRPNATASESEKATSHTVVELMNGIRGHRFHQDAHPRRMVLFIVLVLGFKYISLMFDIHYWYTRVSTVGISLSGTTFLAFSVVFERLVAGFLGTPRLLNPAALSLANTRIYLELIIAFLMIKSIIRREIRWKGKTWVPIVGLIPASHKERASMRLDAQTSWRVRLTILLSLFGFYYFLDPKNIAIFSFKFTLPSMNDIMERSKPIPLALSLGCALQHTGIILQLLLNHRSRHFAGRHNSSMVTAMLHVIFVGLQYVPAVVGRVGLSQGLSVHQALVMTTIVCGSWQALTLPSVPQTEVDEDEE